MSKLSYDEFKEEVLTIINQILPDYEKIVGKTSYACENVDTIIFRSKENASIAPNLRLDNLYKDYVNDRIKISDLVQCICNIVTTPIDTSVSDIIKPENVVIKFLPYHANEDFVKDLITFKFKDLVGYYVCAVNVDGGIMSTKITKNVLKVLNLTKAELHALALENTKKFQEYKVETMYSMLKHLLGDTFPVDMMIDNMMYVITAKLSSTWGATAILYPEILEEAAEQIGDDFYVLPSSIHELILVPVDKCETSELLNMVQEVNQTVVQPQDLLSYSIYKYSRKTQKLTKIANKDVA